MPHTITSAQLTKILDQIAPRLLAPKDRSRLDSLQPVIWPIDGEPTNSSPSLNGFTLNDFVSRAKVGDILTFTAYGSLLGTGHIISRNQDGADFRISLYYPSEKCIRQWSVSGNSISIDFEGLSATGISGMLLAKQIPSLSASKINSGKFSSERIPDLDASKITSGTFDAARIPALPYAASDHSHPEYLTADSSLNGSKITSGTISYARLPTATSTASGIISSTNFKYLLSSTTATAITALSTSYRQVIASISASAAFAFTGSTAFAAGREIHVIIKNTSSSDITVTLPNAGIYDNGGTDTLTIPAGAHAEVNAISDGSKIYLRAVS